MARILVVDDEECMRYTLSLFLSRQGHEVFTARNCEEGISQTIERDFDLIFSDIILGGRTGIEFLRELRERNIVCPVVIITGYPIIDTAAEAVRLGAFDYIAKPVEMDTVLRVARQALEHKKVIDENERFRAHLEAIFRSVDDGILTIDGELRVLEMNDAFGRICGLTRDGIGRRLTGSFMGCGKTFLQALQEAVEEKRSVRMERVECADSGQVPRILTLSASPLMDRQGHISGAVMVVRDETRLVSLEHAHTKRLRFHNMVGGSERMQEIYSLIESIADFESTVLVTGESGTGKELVAEALHHMGIRGRGPLVKVNCSALSENLLESELFGHVRGAFTGAVSDRKGRFQMAEGGSIFLDEIGDISPRVQSNLLRVLQEKEFERVGDTRPVKADVRVIAATNKNLREKVKRGEFREDLYYRLKVIELHIPPLRERKEDIRLLVEHFLKMFSAKFRKEVLAVSADVERLFIDHSWPGNVRELRHALERACILCNRETITADMLAPLALPENETPQSPGEKSELNVAAIRNALEKTDWNKAKASRLLGVDRKTLYRYLEKFHIPKETPDLTSSP